MFFFSCCTIVAAALLVYVWLFGVFVLSPLCWFQCFLETPNKSLPGLSVNEAFTLPQCYESKHKPGSSASFVPVVLSHEFSPALGIGFHSFHPAFLPIPSRSHVAFVKVFPANIRNSKKQNRQQWKPIPYLSRLLPGASSNDLPSFAGFLLFLIWQIPLR